MLGVTKHSSAFFQRDPASLSSLLLRDGELQLQGSSVYQSPSDTQARGPWRLSAEIAGCAEASPESRASRFVFGLLHNTSVCLLAR